MCNIRIMALVFRNMGILSLRSIFSLKLCFRENSADLRDKMPMFRNMRAIIRACERSVSGTLAAQPLMGIYASPAPRSVPAQRPPAPRYAPAPPLSATSAHRSAPAQLIFRPLRSNSAHAQLKFVDHYAVCTLCLTWWLLVRNLSRTKSKVYTSGMRAKEKLFVTFKIHTIQWSLDRVQTEPSCYKNTTIIVSN